MMPASVTVVIITWNRAASLAETLETLHGLRVPDGVRWECLIVDNNCTDNTGEVVASFEGRLPIRRLVEATQGVSAARNRALREARGDLILWLDDDIHVEAGWLEAYVEAANAWPRAAYFGGRIEPRYLCEPPEWARPNTETLQGLLGVRDFGPTARPFPEGEGPYGANMALRRCLFERWTFDERLGHRGTSRVLGEESDLFARARQQGLEGIWVPAARVTHGIPPERLTSDGVRHHFRAYGRALALRGDRQRTWILDYPRWLCRSYCMLTRSRIALMQLTGNTSWVPLLARCSTWEGILDEGP